MDGLKRIPLKNSIRNQYVDCVLVNGDYYFLIPSINKVYKYKLQLKNIKNI